jgi:hypothetical protein
MEIAERNRLPLVQLIESSGADLATQSQIFIPGEWAFRERGVTELLGWGPLAYVVGLRPQPRSLLEWDRDLAARISNVAVPSLLLCCPRR